MSSFCNCEAAAIFVATRASSSKSSPTKSNTRTRSSRHCRCRRRLCEPAAIPGQYRDLIRTTSARHGVDARVVNAVIQVESAYHSRAVSPKGARGLMQLMPATGRQYGALDLFDPKVNLEAGIQHLKKLLDPLRLCRWRSPRTTRERRRSIALAVFHRSERRRITSPASFDSSAGADPSRASGYRSFRPCRAAPCV